METGKAPKKVGGGDLRSTVTAHRGALRGRQPVAPSDALAGGNGSDVAALGPHAPSPRPPRLPAHQRAPHLLDSRLRAARGYADYHGSEERKTAHLTGTGDTRRREVRARRFELGPTPPPGLVPQSASQPECLDRCRGRDPRRAGLRSARGGAGAAVAARLGSVPGPGWLRATRFEMLRAIRAAGNGEAIFSPKVAVRLMDFFSSSRLSAPPEIFPELS